MPAPSGTRPVASATAPGLAAQFGQTPERAIAWFESLGLRITWDWRAEWERSRELAFGVAKVTRLQVLAAIREEVARAIAQGVTQAQFRRYLAGRLGKLGWLRRRRVVGPDGSTSVVDLSKPHRMDVIFRTNAQSAFMAGRFAEQSEQVATHPFWQYVAVMDGRTRPGHAAMNGKVFRADDPIWRAIYPPNGYNCRCRVRTLTPAQVEERGLVVSSSSELPAAFPDPGFDFNPGVPGAQAAAMAAAVARANLKAQSARAPGPGR